MSIWRTPDRHGYDVAQICLNGHVITAEAASSHHEQQKFCDRCGEPTIKACQDCNAPIRGIDHDSRVTSPYLVPHYCYNCGKPYPWTQAKLEAAKEFAEELDGLSSKEKDVLKQSIEELARDTPKTKVAAVKVKKILAKARGAALSMLRDILVDIASETAKKAMGL
jgi:hypothetical protein